MNNLSKSLAAYVTIREEYFGAKPTVLSLADLNMVILNRFDELPIVEVAVILQLVKKDHEALAESRGAGADPKLPTMAAKVMRGHHNYGRAH